MVRQTPCFCALSLAVAVNISPTQAAGPYPPTDWPPTIDASKKVHFVVTDAAPFTTPNANWSDSLRILNDGDQTTADFCIKGFNAKKATASYFNIADSLYTEWNTVPQVDILVQVFGDISVMNPANQNQSRTWSFREGTTGSSVESGNSINGAAYSTNAFNRKWNWILFSITNKVVTGGTDRYIGSVPAGSAGNTTYGGVNGGTIRIGSSLNGLTIHAVAFGEAGAFGTAADINTFEAPDVSCPVPAANLVGIDFNAGVTNHLQVLNDGDQTVTFSVVGPDNDKRTAVRPDGSFLNFGILDNYLGLPCTPNTTVKVCVDFYDDPAYAGAGVQFGPEAYATDDQTCVAVYPSSNLQMLEGSGQWIRRSWVIAGVSLRGVNTGSLTGGPRLICVGGPVAISRFYMAALRTGSDPLAGQDPLADCYSDPLVCKGAYGDHVELDLAKDLRDGLDLGSNSGDQQYVTEQAGPANDQRLSVRPAWDDGTAHSPNLNFVILTNALGPSTQDNARLAIAVTYYDDPAYVGKGFRPQVWKMNYAGSLLFNYMDPPRNMVLQGTGKWRDAYWEIPAVNFSGVNQSPQAAARFECEERIHFSRVRYAVIRGCGTTAGQNLLENKVTLSAVPGQDSTIRFSWPYVAPQATLESSQSLNGTWTTATGAASVESETRVLSVTNSAAAEFFHLKLQYP